MLSRYSNVRVDYVNIRAGKTPDARFFICEADIIAEVEGENEKIAMYKVVFDTVIDQHKSSVEYYDSKAKNSSIVINALKVIRRINFVGENDPEDDNTYKGIKRNCDTCEYVGLEGVCSGDSVSESCDSWRISLDAFSIWIDENKKTRIISFGGSKKN